MVIKAAARTEPKHKRGVVKERIGQGERERRVFHGALWGGVEPCV